MGNVKVVVNLAITFGASGHLSPWSLQASGTGTLNGLVMPNTVTVTLLVRFLMVTSVGYITEATCACHLVLLESTTDMYIHTT